MSGENSHQTVRESVRQSVSHSVIVLASGVVVQISNKFLNVTLTMFFFSKLQESAYKPVYAAICTDGKVSLMSNMTTKGGSGKVCNCMAYVYQQSCRTSPESQELN